MTPSPAPSSTGSIGRPKTERCQRLTCIDVGCELKDVQQQLKDVQTQLEADRANAFKTHCKGEERRLFDVAAAATLAELETLKKEMWDIRKNNTRNLATANKLGHERFELLSEIAGLKGELAIATASIAQMTKRQVMDKRAWGREEKKLSAALKSAVETEEATRLLAAEEVADVEEVAAKAMEEAACARQEALDEARAAEDTLQALDMKEYQLMLSQRQVKRAHQKQATLDERIRELEPIAINRSASEWANLRADAQRKATQRERQALRSFLKPHGWRAADLSVVLDELGLLNECIFGTKEGWHCFFLKVKELHSRLENDDFGIRFGLFMHFEMRLTLPKIQQMVEAACKEYNRGSDRCKKKPWLSNPHDKSMVLMTPRIVPARTKLEPVIKAIGKTLGVQPSEEGLLAFRGFDLVVQELLMRDTGKLKMPTLPEFYGGLNLPIVISRDATGKGSLQFTTAAARSPWASKSAQTLHIFAFGNCGDDRSGSSRLFGPNLKVINDLVEAAAEGRCSPVTIEGEVRNIMIDPYFTDDVSALRHGEHMANSGWCGCSRDKALRQVPIASKPSTIAEMRAFVNGDTGSCRELSCRERDILSHNPLPGKDIPEPCIAPGCKFGHDPSKAAAEYAGLLATEAALATDKSKRGKSKFTEWGMQHAWKGSTPHLNVRPGLHGRPLFRHHMKKQILDGLHHSELGAPKTPFKHGLLNNASD